MLKHKDFDNYSEDYYEISIPENINSISFSHDGGRISIEINNEEIYSTIFGTRDCCIEIDRR